MTAGTLDLDGWLRKRLTAALANAPYSTIFPLSAAAAEECEQIEAALRQTGVGFRLDGTPLRSGLTLTIVGDERLERWAKENS